MEPARKAEAPDRGVEEKPQEIDVAVDAPVEARSGAYTNFANVTADGDGVTIDFFSVDPGSPLPDRGVLQARIRMSHRMSIRLLDALRTNVASWARQELLARKNEEQTLSDLAGGESPNE